MTLHAEFHAPKLSASVGNVIIQGGVDVQPLSVTENGTYAESGKAFSPVVVNVEGLVPTGTLTITENGNYDVTEKAEAAVNVQPPLETATVTPTKQTQEIEPISAYGLSLVTVDPIPDEYIVPSGTQSISANGQYDITDKAAVDVQVPNSYTQADEGKVVSSGALVSQTSRIVSDNGTYDTTLNNEIVVNNEDYADALVAFGVEDDLADGIEAMTTYANEVTGESDTTLSDAVRTLADGYGGGGSLPSVISQIKGGSFTLGIDTSVPAYPISHGLGAVPTGVLLWTEDRLEGTPRNRYVQSYYISTADLTVNVAVAASTILNINGSATTLYTSFTSTNVSNVWTTENFKYTNSALCYKAGVTYKWIAVLKSS